MGLDIYMHSKAEKDAAKAHEERWGNLFGDEDGDQSANPFGKPWSEFTEDEQSAYWDESDKVGGHEAIKSEAFPNNINERRYLRSSYNDSGFNSVVPMVLGDDKADYYGIMAPILDASESDYDIVVNDLDVVAAARANAVSVVERMEEIGSTPVRRSMDVTVVNPFATELPNKTEAQALALANESLDRDNPFGGGWSSRDGFFMPEGMNVVALIPGVNLLGSLSMHVIYEEPVHESYVESAKVLVEFLDELAMLVERDGEAYIYWSG